jgi:hypothetical protein
MHPLLATCSSLPSGSDSELGVNPGLSPSTARSLGFAAGLIVPVVVLGTALLVARRFNICGAQRWWRRRYGASELPPGRPVGTADDEPYVQHAKWVGVCV